MNETVKAERQSLWPSISNEALVLILSLMVLTLSYIAEVSNSYLPGKWLVGCCGKTFWWSPVGGSIVLVAAALILRLRRAWSYVATAFLAIYTFCSFSNMAIQRWLNYSPVTRYISLCSLSTGHRELFSACSLPVLRLHISVNGGVFQDSTGHRFWSRAQLLVTL